MYKFGSRELEHLFEFSVVFLHNISSSSVRDTSRLIRLLSIGEICVLHISLLQDKYIRLQFHGWINFRCLLKDLGSGLSFTSTDKTTVVDNWGASTSYAIFLEWLKVSGLGLRLIFSSLPIFVRTILLKSDWGLLSFGELRIKHPIWSSWDRRHRGLGWW